MSVEAGTSPVSEIVAMLMAGEPNGFAILRMIQATAQWERELFGREYSTIERDMILHVMIETAAGRQVTLPNLAYFCHTSPATAARKLETWVDLDLLVKQSDQRDRRRALIQPTSRFTEWFEEYVAAARRALRENASCERILALERRA